MTLITYIRTMDRRLRLMLVSTALLLLPLIGQFVAISSINKTGRESTLAFFLMAAAIFIVPTSLIFSTVIMAVLREHWREHKLIFAFGAINLLIIVSVTWFFIEPCGWAQTFGIALRGCR